MELTLDELVDEVCLSPELKEVYSPLTENIQIMVNEIREYTNNTRGLYELGVDNSCVYRSPKNGNMCIIGKHIPENVPEEVWTYGDNVEELREQYPDIFNQGFFENMPICVLNGFQTLHDTDLNYDDKGLTDHGKRKVQEFIKELNEIGVNVK